MNVSRLLHEKRDEILELADKHGAINVRVFGSAARGDASASSDIDLLVDMKQGSTLLDLVALWQDLEELFGCKVHVLSEGGISPHLRDRIYSEARPL
ncbi:MAG: nucleotidyltransferase family protein [Desulfomonile tiedjei]|nr:nucleotidyltransferase family protein [Desulfomonile tiedjei]